MLMATVRPGARWLLHTAKHAARSHGATCTAMLARAPPVTAGLECPGSCESALPWPGRLLSASGRLHPHPQSLDRLTLYIHISLSNTVHRAGAPDQLLADLGVCHLLGRAKAQNINGRLHTLPAKCHATMLHTMLYGTHSVPPRRGSAVFGTQLGKLGMEQVISNELLPTEVEGDQQAAAHLLTAARERETIQGRRDPAEQVGRGPGRGMVMHLDSSLMQPAACQVLTVQLVSEYQNLPHGQAGCRGQ